MKLNQNPTKTKGMNYLSTLLLKKTSWTLHMDLDYHVIKPVYKSK